MRPTVTNTYHHKSVFFVVLIPAPTHSFFLPQTRISSSSTSSSSFCCHFRSTCSKHLSQNRYCYFCHCYRYFHTTLLLNTLPQILSISSVAELTTQLLILENILWLPLCRINKFGLNTLPSKTVVIPYTCGLSRLFSGAIAGEHSSIL